MGEPEPLEVTLARIEGMLNATLPELTAKNQALSSEMTTLHGRVTNHGHQLAGHKERIEDLEERSKGQLGRAATIVAFAGGLVGLLSAVLPALAPVM